MESDHFRDIIINSGEVDTSPDSASRALRQPLAPGSFSDLLAEHGGRLPDVIRQHHRPTVKGRYVHWDRLRHLPVPEGLSHEEWWLGIKLARRTQYRSLPLRDTRGRPFAYMLPDPVQEALHRIDSQARGWIGAPEHVTNPSTRDRFIVSSLIEEAITSSQLEGASTSRIVAADMIRSRRKPPGSERAHDSQQLSRDGRHPPNEGRAAEPGFPVATARHAHRRHPGRSGRRRPHSGTR